MNGPTPLRIAMWSGPRNISTALMRAWGNREDTTVRDEPFYAHYLQETGREHPGADEVIAHHETDWRTVVAALTGPVPEGKPIFYQKHMAQHLLPHIDREWLGEVTNCFLIRDPRAVINSFLKNVPDPTIEDLGFPQQWEVFQFACQSEGRVPPVLDSRDVLEDPREALGRLCEALEVEFSDAMLSWPAGRRETDGIWAKYWYANVEQSTGFNPPGPEPDEVPRRFRKLYEECMSYYRRLYEHRLAD